MSTTLLSVHCACQAKLNMDCHFQQYRPIFVCVYHRQTWKDNVGNSHEVQLSPMRMHSCVFRHSRGDHYPVKTRCLFFILQASAVFTWHFGKTEKLSLFMCRREIKPVSCKGSLSSLELYTNFFSQKENSLPGVSIPCLWPGCPDRLVCSWLCSGRRRWLCAPPGRQSWTWFHPLSCADPRAVFSVLLSPPPESKQKQVCLVSAKAEHPNHSSRGGGGQPARGGSSMTMTQTWLHKADSTWSRARPKNHLSIQ